MTRAPRRKGLGMAAAMVEKKRTFDAAFKLMIINYTSQYN